MDLPCPIDQGGSADGPVAERYVAEDFEQVYEANVRFVWRTLRRLGVPDEDCDDAVQDVFLIVHRKLPGYRPDAPIRHWLYRLTAGIARDRRRSRQRKDPRQHGLIPISSHENELVDPSQETPAEAADSQAAARLLRVLLEGLEETRREIFVMVEVEQLSAPEVATILGIPLNTVYSRLRRARNDFEAALHRHRVRSGQRGEG